MSQYVHLGAAALNTTPKHWDENKRVILKSIQEAKKRGINILCLPELAITGYGCEDEFHAPYVSEWSLQILFQDIAPATTDIAVAVGLPVQFEGATYNTIAMLINGQVAGFSAKQHLAGDGIHYEPRFFKPWPKKQKAQLTYQENQYPIGDILFDLSGIRVGFEICEDAWVAGRPGIALAQRSVDIILNPSASHFALGKASVRERFVQEGSRAFHCAYVYANLLGNEAGRAIYDGDCMIASQGTVVCRSELFRFDDTLLVNSIVDIETNRVSRNRQASYRPAPEDSPYAVHHQWQPICNQTPTTQPRPEPTADPYLEFELATGLGLFDYMRKSWTNGFAISLSGGADSSACLTIVYRMACKLIQHYPDHPYLKHLLDGATATLPELMSRICVTAYQGTDNSSDQTLQAASELAKATSARFQNINVKNLVNEYENILANFIGRPLNWQDDDLARQNIQARCRAPSIWAIANASNFLLISTSNRSEAAVGYCTMDGDTAGSISPIAGIDKQFLRDWLKWAEQQHLPALKYTNQLVPTAELRPQTATQTDEEDLMPYPVLNQIQKLAVIEKKCVDDIYDQLSHNHPDQSPQTIFQWIQRYFTLWSRNQWKRERYAPSFHLDDENLDPRSWCRYPILSGSYQAELNALKKRIQKQLPAPQ